MELLESIPNVRLFGGLVDRHVFRAVVLRYARGEVMDLIDMVLGGIAVTLFSVAIMEALIMANHEGEDKK